MSITLDKVNYDDILKAYSEGDDEVFVKIGTVNGKPLFFGAIYIEKMGEYNKHIKDLVDEAVAPKLSLEYQMNILPPTRLYKNINFNMDYNILLVEGKRLLGFYCE